MKKLTTKTKISTIALILILTISAIIIALPIATAQEPVYEMQTHAYLGVIPNPVGVGQEVLLHIGITHYLEISTDGWEGITVTVQKPDGTTDTLGPFSTDSTGGTGTIYVPTMAGTHSLQTHFPEQVYIWSDTSRAHVPGGGPILYEASVSNKIELVVQPEPVDYYPPASLPEEFWTRPIDSQLREWSTLAGSWLSTPPNNLAKYTEGPESAHILWSHPLTVGGLVGGDTGEHAFECGDAYEGKWRRGTIILAGKLYYQDSSSTDKWQRIVCVDLHTGEELWRKTLLDNRTLSFGQLMYWSTLNNHGVYDYLWVTVGSTWHAFDSFNGDWVYSIENVPSGTRVYGPNGELLIYTLDLGDGWMTQWNSTSVYWNTLMDETDGYEYHAGRWRPQGRTFEASYGIDWNVSIPTGLPGRAVFLEDRLLGYDIPRFTTEIVPEITTWGISLEPTKRGQLLFKETWRAPIMDVRYGWSCASKEDGIFIITSIDTRQHWSFSIDTGAMVWGPTDSYHYMNMWHGGYSITGGTSIAYGKLFTTGYSGIVYCHDASTGNLLWTYTTKDPHNEILWGDNWPLYYLFVADGKLYLGQTEHSVIDPKPRGGPFVCLDLETGDEVWRIDGAFRQTVWGGRAIIGDGIIATMNTYDQCIYGIGKGPSATTLTAPDVGVQLGCSVMLRGKVTDVSPGTNDIAISTRFPNGVPAASDASMSEWMKYVYMQFERPTNMVGVTVKLEAVDPNGNYVNLGTATSDVYGNYGFTYKPEVEGQYMIIATFEGSNSYYGSTETTYLTVDPEPSPSTPIEPEQPATEAPLITTEVALIAAVAVACVIGVAAYWVLKKRK